MKSKDWFRLHSFTGVVTGLLLFIICWSGTLAVFAHELDWLTTPARHVEPAGEQASWGRIQEVALAAWPDHSFVSLAAPLNRFDAVTVQLRGPDGGTRVVWVDPYRGEVTGSRDHGYDIHRFFRNFHRTLFLPDVGLYLVSLFAITMLVSLVAALYFYKRWWTRFFRFQPGRGRAFWSELHKTGGLWSLWFVLLMGVTGLWYLYEAGFMDFAGGAANYVGSAEYAVVEVPEPEEAAGREPLSLEDMVNRVRNEWPAFRISRIGQGWFSGQDGAMYFGGTAGFPLVRPRASQIQVDRYSGEILWRNDASELPVYWIWSNMADPLHFGDFGGWISKTIWFVFGLALSGLILTGTWLHARRLGASPGARKRHRWPGTTTAAVVTLVILFASIVFGLLQARDVYGPIVEGVRRFPDLPLGSDLVLFGWIGLTVAIIVLWLFMLWRPERLAGPSGKHH